MPNKQNSLEICGIVTILLLFGAALYWVYGVKRLAPWQLRADITEIQKQLEEHP